jgi:hypothetical protein
MVTLAATQTGATFAKNVGKQKDVKDMGYSMSPLTSLY